MTDPDTDKLFRTYDTFVAVCRDGRMDLETLSRYILAVQCHLVAADSPEYMLLAATHRVLTRLHTQRVSEAASAA